MARTSRSLLIALLVVFAIIVVGESIALLSEYLNSTYLQQYISSNLVPVGAGIFIVAIVALGAGLFAYRRASPVQASLPERPTNIPEAQAPGQGWLRVFGDTKYLFARSLKKLLRNPILLFFSLFQPIIFILLFTQLFSRFAQFPGFPTPGNYIQFAVAGIVLQNGFSSAFQSGTSMVDDLRSGFLVKMLATPVSRPAILLGRISTDMFRMVVQSSIILFLAYLLGAFPNTGVHVYLLMLITIALFGLAWSGISLSIGLKTRSAETVFGIAGTLTFPLLFMSTALVPAGLMPNWMADVSGWNPISITVDAMRAFMGIQNYGWDLVLKAYGAIALIGVLTMGATLYLFRKVIS